ncbi:MAG: 50S ribosome-binding GTPase [Deltaproteobacteria bacterium]|nr:50S ribosome-binding GTPase [Deltaproteobacteria bacterium]
MMISNVQTGTIKALGKIEGFKHDVRMLCDAIDRAPMWHPGTGLRKQCDEVLRMINHLEARFERKLIVTIIGPCGSGKSTLLNALAQVDNLSETGHRRPTTQSIVVLGRETKDADHLREQLGVSHVDMRSSPAAESLEHVLLIDTPDTDSTQQEKHIHLVQNAIAVSDILICMFDAENPKRKDHVDFLARYVRLFNGDALMVVINKCDRQNKKELDQIIVPEFLDFIKTAWGKPIQKIFCISARRHLQDPQWDPTARPKHDFDEFIDLRQMIFGTFNQPGYSIDRRIGNAQSLRDYIFEETAFEIQKDSEKLKETKQHIREAEKNALNSALSAFKKGDSKRILGINVLVYQKLAQRWLGPVGWLIAVWARILIFGTGIVSMFRFGNPIRQLAGMVSSLFHFKESKAAAAEAERSDWIDFAMRDFRLSVLQDWPDIAESLVNARFDTRVRKIDHALSDNISLNQDLNSLWGDALDHTMETASQNLSGLILQILFNLPVIGILGHVGWITARDYFTGQYLSSDFFLHAFLTIAITLFLSFFVFQGCVRLAAGPERIARKAFEKMKRQIERFQPISMNPVGEQVDTLLSLGSINQSVQ